MMKKIIVSLAIISFLFFSILTINNTFAAGPQSAQPSITVTSPNGGEIWGVGEVKPFNITWKITGNIGWISIYLMFEDDATGFVTDAYGPDGKIVIWLGANATFSDTGRILTDGRYKIFITNSFRDMNYKGPYVGDESDNFFLIVSSVASGTGTASFPIIVSINSTKGILLGFNESIAVATDSPNVFLFGKIIVYKYASGREVTGYNLDEWVKTKKFSLAYKKPWRSDYLSMFEIQTYEKGIYMVDITLIPLNIGGSTIWERSDRRDTPHSLLIVSSLSGNPPAPPPDGFKGAPAKNPGNGGKLYATWGSLKKG